MPQSNARRYRRKVIRMPENRHRIYTRWWYLYRVLRLLRMKRLTWHLFRTTRTLWTEWAVVPGRRPKLLRAETLTSPAIAILINPDPVTGEA